MERFYTLKEAKMLPGVTTKTIQRWDEEEVKEASPQA
jgi:hypothetical protein